MKATSHQHPCPEQPPKIVREIFLLWGAALFCVPFAIGAVAKPWNQTDWKQWTDKDALQVLYSSPWATYCCRGRQYDDDSAPGPAVRASIISSLVVRQALVRRMEFTKAYKSLDVAGRKDFDQRVAVCLNQRFDDQIVVTFSLDLFHDPIFKWMKSDSSLIHIVTSDGRDIAGRAVSESVGEKCGWLLKSDLRPDYSSFEMPLYGPNHELAFPRFVDGKLTIRPDDKQIRIKLDFRSPFIRGVSDAVSHGGEFDFKLDRMIYLGKPDF